jgi:ATP-dependent Clp protease ATP-binding subunit ClpA
MVFTLLRKTKNNPLLIGEAGVGKTAVVEWLAQRILTILL